MAQTQPQYRKWSVTQREFDKLKDIDEIFYFLRDIVHDSDVCTNAECDVFPSLFHLDENRLDYEYKTMAEAKKGLVNNKPQLQKYQDLFNEYMVKSKRIMAEIYALKVSGQAQAREHMQHHEEYLETIEYFNRNNQPIPIQASKEAEAKQQEIAKNASVLDEKTKKARAEFEAFQKEQKERELKIKENAKKNKKGKN